VSELIDRPSLFKKSNPVITFVWIFDRNAEQDAVQVSPQESRSRSKGKSSGSRKKTSSSTV
jgi:hypothetical protein